MTLRIRTYGEVINCICDQQAMLMTSFFCNRLTTWFFLFDLFYHMTNCQLPLNSQIFILDIFSRLIFLARSKIECTDEIGKNDG